MNVTTLVNRGKVNISISEYGSLIVTVDGKPARLEFGKNISTVASLDKGRSKPLAAQLKKVGATHCLGCAIALYEGEAEIIQLAVDNHPVNVKKRAEFETECAKLSAEENKWNKETAWRIDARLGFAEGSESETLDIDNTPSHKQDF
jgi:uncharacterized protein (DUF1684 family)